MKKKILVTSALPYANGPLHFGHIAGAYLPGDCYARFERLRGNDVLYVCGSDEYGVAITLSAEMAGRTPQEHVDRYHAENKALFDKLHFAFDHYSRTTNPYHEELVQEYFLDLLHNGYIEERVTDQLYSPKDNRFLADRYVQGTCPQCGFEKARGDECPACGASYEATDLKNPVSKITGAKLVKKPTKHWFLLLDQFKERLKEWIATKNWKPNVVKFIQGYINHMHARAITRDSEWGVPVPLPDSEGKVLYVWFDAPIGYLSATKEWAVLQGAPERWKEYWCDPTAELVQFIGKDNIPFHATIFPAMTMGQNHPYKTVDELPANEFFHLEGRKFNKSEGWTIDLQAFFDHYTADQIRYTIAANAPESSDAEFTWKDFQSRCNSDLLGKLGNFVHRTLVFAHKQCEGRVPSTGTLEESDREFLDDQRAHLQEIESAYAGFHLRKAAKAIMELAQRGNAYFDHKAPWKDAKDEATRGRMETTIALCLEAVKGLALAAHPILPDATEQMWKLLGQTPPLSQQLWKSVVEESLAPSTPLGVPKTLFRRVEDEEIAQERAKLKQLLAKKEREEKMISIDDFGKLELRVGEVKAAEPILKSDKLLYLTVDMGSEERKIVSGIRDHYTPEDVVGKKVVVVANLKPATVRGKVSEGMVLAGLDGAQLELVEVKHLPPGTLVR